MAATFKFELVSPERVVMSEDAEMVVIPGAEGEFAVMPGHAPVISTIRPGVIQATLPGGKKSIFVKGGLAEVGPESTTILAEHSFVVDKGDPRQIENELAAVEKALSEEKDEEALDHLKRAIADLKALPAH